MKGSLQNNAPYPSWVEFHGPGPEDFFDILYYQECTLNILWALVIAKLLLIFWLYPRRPPELCLSCLLGIYSTYQCLCLPPVLEALGTAQA